MQTVRTPFMRKCTPFMRGKPSKIPRLCANEYPVYAWKTRGILAWMWIPPANCCICSVAPRRSCRRQGRYSAIDGPSGGGRGFCPFRGAPGRWSASTKRVHFVERETRGGRAGDLRLRFGIREGPFLLAPARVAGLSCASPLVSRCKKHFSIR